MVKREANVGPCLILLSQLTQDILSWFHKKQDSAKLLDHLNALTPEFAALEPWTQGTLLARLKQEQSNLRRTIIRIHTIRETSFISAGYLLSYIITVLLCIGLIFAKFEPFYESLFLVSVISYLLIFLLMLIKDLDNPFGYYEGGSAVDVSLKPLEYAAHQLAQIASVEASVFTGSGKKCATSDTTSPSR